MLDFSQEFDIFKDRIDNDIPFGFSRFSDGELFILQNKKVVLAENGYVTGDIQGGGHYPKEEQKEFDPEKHADFKDKLMETFVTALPNYFKGISGKVDVGEEDYQWQMDLLKETPTEYITFANVFINNNYPRFINEIVPLLAQKEVSIVANEAAVFDNFPIPIKTHFKIGNNCLHNNLGMIEEVKEYLRDKKEEYVLCSASSLSNLIVYHSCKDNPNNTIIDIGSSLSPWMGPAITGWMYSRAYLQHWVLGKLNQYGTKVDVW